MAFARRNIHPNKEIRQCWIDTEDGNKREQVIRQGTGVDGSDKGEIAGLHRRSIVLRKGFLAHVKEVGSNGLQAGVQPHEGKKVRGVFVDLSVGAGSEPEVQFDPGGHPGEGDNDNTLILNKLNPNIFKNEFKYVTNILFCITYMASSQVLSILKEGELKDSGIIQHISELIRSQLQPNNQLKGLPNL